MEMYEYVQRKNGDGRDTSGDPKRATCASPVMDMTMIISSSVSSVAVAANHSLDVVGVVDGFDCDQTVIALSWADLIEHRNYLIRFARQALRDASQAEDVVHDVFEAVVCGQARFAGRSALRTWLIAVLKNKIVDTIRRNQRFDSMVTQTQDEDGPQIICTLAMPDELAEQRQRLYRVIKKIKRLKQDLRDVIQFSVLEDESTEAVCKRLGISESILYVRLHRARKLLI